MRRAAPHIAFALGFVLLGAVFLGPGAGRAHACSCAFGGGIGTADAVFSGTVADLPEEGGVATGFGMSIDRIVFDVEGSWKGVSEDPVTVYGQGGRGSSDGDIAVSTCDFVFDLDESYLVYAFEAEDDGKEILTTNTCSDTKRLAEAGADLASLGQPTATLAGGELVPTGGLPLVPAVAVALFAFALAVAGALLRARRSNA